jgi:hypothetical protein
MNSAPPTRDHYRLVSQRMAEIWPAALKQPENIARWSFLGAELSSRLRAGQCVRIIRHAHGGLTLDTVALPISQPEN